MFLSFEKAMSTYVTDKHSSLCLLLWFTDGTYPLCERVVSIQLQFVNRQDFRVTDVRSSDLRGETENSKCLFKSVTFKNVGDQMRFITELKIWLNPQQSIM